MGKRVAFIYKAKTLKQGTRFRCIWGKVCLQTLHAEVYQRDAQCTRAACGFNVCSCIKLVYVQITRAHGSVGSVQAKFSKDLPSKALVCSLVPRNVSAVNIDHKEEL